jgi:hypothetical protein
MTMVQITLCKVICVEYYRYHLVNVISLILEQNTLSCISILICCLAICHLIFHLKSFTKLSLRYILVYSYYIQFYFLTNNFSTSELFLSICLLSQMPPSVRLSVCPSVYILCIFINYLCVSVSSVCLSENFCPLFKFFFVFKFIWQLNQAIIVLIIKQFVNLYALDTVGAA